MIVCVEHNVTESIAQFYILNLQLATITIYYVTEKCDSPLKNTSVLICGSSEQQT